ncbi:hypothetical protein BDL97_11G038900 [Sphagnum fallax]|nr:hypothetical protein BDL97_11G038900 [Sphagnum fallax]
MGTLVSSLHEQRAAKAESIGCLDWTLRIVSPPLIVRSYYAQTGGPFLDHRLNTHPIPPILPSSDYDSTDSDEFRVRIHRFYQLPLVIPPILPISGYDSTNSTKFRVRFHESKNERPAVARSGTPVSPTASALCSPSSSSASLFLRSSIHRSGTVSLSARRAETRRFSPLPIRAVSSDDSTPDASKQFEELYTDLKAKWDGVENKTTVGVYAGGAIVALWLSSTIVGAINSLPLLPKLMELIGLGYTGWFIYRYLLFKSSRKELVADIQELKRKVTGAMKEEGL